MIQCIARDTMLVATNLHPARLRPVRLIENVDTGCVRCETDQTGSSWFRHATGFSLVESDGISFCCLRESNGSIRFLPSLATIHDPLLSLPSPHARVKIGFHQSLDRSTLITRFIDPAITEPINRPLLCSLAYPLSEIRSTDSRPSRRAWRSLSRPGAETLFFRLIVLDLNRKSSFVPRTR